MTPTSTRQIFPTAAIAFSVGFVNESFLASGRVITCDSRDKISGTRGATAEPPNSQADPIPYTAAYLKVNF